MTPTLTFFLHVLKKLGPQRRFSEGLDLHSQISVLIVFLWLTYKQITLQPGGLQMVKAPQAKHPGPGLTLSNPRRPWEITGYDKWTFECERWFPEKLWKASVSPHGAAWVSQVVKGNIYEKLLNHTDSWIASRASWKTGLLQASGPCTHTSNSR